MSNPRRECTAYALPGADRCLAHASDIDREAFLDGTDRPDDWPRYLQRLEVSDKLVAGMRQLAELEEGLDFSGATFLDAVDFERVVFRGPTCFESARFEASAYFANATFESDVIFRGTQFCADAHFEYVLFREDAYWPEAHFDAVAWFSGAAFASVCDVRNAVFADKCEFVDVTFQGAAVFDQVGFGDTAEFWAATFATSATFLFASFAGKADFWKARFTGPASFTGVELEGGAWFEEAVIEREVTFHGDEDAVPGLVHFVRTEFGRHAHVTLGCHATFEDVVVRNPLTVVSEGTSGAIVSFEGTAFDAPVVVGEGIRLTACRFARATGLANLRATGDPQWMRFRNRFVIADEMHYWLALGVVDARSLARRHDLDAEVGARHPHEIEAAYRQLRLAPDTTHAAVASDFNYGEMEMRRCGARGWSAERQLLLFYKVFSGYGRRAWRAVASYAVVLAVIGACMRWQGHLFLRACDPGFVCDQSVAGGLHSNRLGDMVVLAFKGSAQLMSNVETAPFRPLGVALFVGLRLVGFLFFCLTVLAVRSRVRRSPWARHQAEPVSSI
ncbi:MAG: pentapeptide repeat-containing protein [Acidimicrobiia bacterium]